MAQHVYKQIFHRHLERQPRNEHYRTKDSVRLSYIDGDFFSALSLSTLLHDANTSRGGPGGRSEGWSVGVRAKGVDQ